MWLNENQNKKISQKAQKGQRYPLNLSKQSLFRKKQKGSGIIGNVLAKLIQRAADIVAV